MDIRQLTFFTTIADLGSLSAAAEKLNISQPTLSLHLVELERHFEAQLMLRGARGMSLTPEGEIFYRHAKWMLARLNEGLADIGTLRKTQRDARRLGLPPSVGAVLAVSMAETLRIERPHLRLQIIESLSGHLKTLLLDGRIDLAILYDLEGISRFPGEHVLDETLVFVSAPDTWPFATGPEQPVALAQLPTVELTLPSQPHGLRQIIDQAAARAGLILDVPLEMDALPHIRELVVRGSAHSILSPAAVQDLVACGRLLQAPISPAITRPLYMVQGPRGDTELVSLLKAMIAEMISRGFWPGSALPTTVKAASDAPPIRLGGPARS